MERTQPDTMVPFLAGWIAGQLMREGRECMEITQVLSQATGNIHDGCLVVFASDLRLRVIIVEKSA